MKRRIKIICFDIDNTICKTKKNYYKSSKPDFKSIDKVNDLYSRGYYIKLFTSRFMGRNYENIVKAKKQAAGFTKKQLKKWNVKYHKLIFGKPSFDLIVDDKTLFLKKEWYKFIDKRLKKNQNF